MVCECGLITPVFRLMALSVLINDDTYQLVQSTAETYEQVHVKTATAT